MKISKSPWDKIAELYNQEIGKNGDPLHQKYIDPLIFKYLGKMRYKAILDAGCGNGYLFGKLGKQADRIVGVDASKELLKFAQRHSSDLHKVVIQHANLLKELPFANNKFDVVIANMVLEYLPKLEKFASESARVLKDKGVLIVIVDHPGHGLFHRAQELAGKKSKKFIDSDSYFEPGMRLKKSLLEKVEIEYFHRPIMDYINPFTKYFHLEKIDEVSENKETPRILGMKWKKL